MTEDYEKQTYQYHWGAFTPFVCPLYKLLAFRLRE